MKEELSMFRAIRDRLNWRSGKVRLAVAAAICAAGLGTGLGGSALLAQLNEGNPVPNTEAIQCPYISQSGCDTTGLVGCVGNPLYEEAVRVDYNGGCTVGTFGCGDMPVPDGEIPCGPATVANCH